MIMRELLVVIVFLSVGCAGGSTNDAAPTRNIGGSYEQRVDTVRKDILPPSHLGIGPKGLPGGPGQSAPQTSEERK